MRNEEVVRFFADLAQHETNWHKRIWWMQLLGFIGETFNSEVADDTRTPIDTATNRQLYQKYAKAVYEEWKATQVHPSTRIPCPESLENNSPTVQPPASTEVPETPSFIDTLYWVSASLRDVSFVLKSSFRASPTLGETTISVDSAYMLHIKTMKDGTLHESKVNVKDLDIGDNGVYLIKPTKAIAYPGFSIKIKPGRPEVQQFKNSKSAGNAKELQFHMADQQHVEWLLQQLQYIIGYAQGL